jgi:hypothetical protein
MAVLAWRSPLVPASLTLQHMDSPSGTIESLWEATEAYGKTTYELSRLKLLEITAAIVTSLVARTSVMLAVVMFLFVLTIGVALWLGEYLGHAYYGFFIVAAFYLLAAVVMHLRMSRWISESVFDQIVEVSLKNK